MRHLPRKIAFKPGEEDSVYNAVAGKYNAVGSYLLLGTSILNTAKRLHAWTKTKYTWSIAIPSDDWLYDEVHRWLLRTIEDHDVRSLVAMTGGRSKYDHHLDSMREARKLMLFSDDRRVHRIVIDGHKVEVMIDKPDYSDKKNFDLRAEERIQFTVSSTSGRQAIIHLLERLAEEKRTRDKTPKFNMLTSWGEWNARSDVPSRTIESVILRTGQAEALIEDMHDFLRSEEDYVRRTIPYHRGYLFYGPPGSGKTSIARALATHFKLDMWYLPLRDVKNDTKLLNLISEVSPGSILLLEDIDVFHAVASRDDDSDSDDDGKGVSLSGILNALDGVATPHGLITIMTTNHIEVLDEALIRSGRVDRKELIGYADDDQAMRMFEHFYQRKPTRPLFVPPETAPSDLSEIFKRHMHDPFGAEEEVVGLVTSVA